MDGRASHLGRCRRGGAQPRASRQPGGSHRRRPDRGGPMGYPPAHRGTGYRHFNGGRMNSTYRVAVLVGSLRKASITRRVADALGEIAPAERDLEQVAIGNLELYNQDFDDENVVPAAWRKFRDRMAEFDAVLFVTPEYNRSVPAVLKN